MGFLICWSPYAVVSLYRVFGTNIVSPMMATLPAFFAKFSLAWPSLITLVLNKEIRMKIKSEESYSKNSSTQVN